MRHLFLAATLAAVLSLSACGGKSSSSSDSGNDNNGGSPSTPWTPDTLDWVTLGPTGLQSDTNLIGAGKLVAMSLDPAQSTVMLAVGNDGGPGMLRSTDGGASWQAANAGLTTADGYTDSALQDVWFVPDAPNIALTISSNGIYRSADDGRTWTNVLRQPRTASSGVDAFISVGTQIFAATNQGVLTSLDHGKTWNLHLAGQVSTLSSSNNVTLAALQANGNGFLYTYANGHWQLLPATLPASIHQIAINPVNANIIYVTVDDGAYDQNLYASTDGGSSFVKVPFPDGTNYTSTNKNNLLGAQAIAFSAAFPQRLYVAGDYGAVYTMGDGNPAPVYTDIQINADVRRLYIGSNASRSDDICWTASDQGLHRTDNCASSPSSWISLNGTLSTHLVTGFAISADGNNLIAMLQDYSSAVSSNGGASWGQTGFDEDGAAAFSPANALNCYALVGGLQVSHDGCKTFVTTPTAIGNPVYQGQSIAFDPAHPSSIYAIAYLDDNTARIFRSLDDGQTLSDTGWKDASGVPIINAQSIVIDPADGSHILTARDSGVVVSFDGGQSNFIAPLGLPASYWNAMIAIQPGKSSRVIVALEQNQGISLYASNDGGRTFTKSSSLPASASNLSGLAFNPNAPANATPLLSLITLQQGAYLSTDMGTSWQRLDKNLVAHKITSMQWLNGSLYLGTYGQGIVKSATVLQ